jgi:hypothetical protein
VFGHALIDDDCEPLADLGYYSVSLPRVLRSMAGKRPDVILASLKEDQQTVQKCTPFVSIFGTQVMLVHMVVRNTLARLIVDGVRVNSDRSEIELVDLRRDLNEIRSAIGRIAYVNGDRTDCRRENLREL